MSYLDALNKINNSMHSKSYVKPMALPSGATRFKIIPGVDDPMRFALPFGQFFIKPLVKGDPYGVCGDSFTTTGEYGPVGGEIKRCVDTALNSGRDDVAEAMKALYPSQTFLMNVIAISDGEATPSYKFIRLAKTAMEQLSFLATNWINDNPGKDLLDWNDGICFNLVRSGKGFDTKYTLSTCSNTMPQIQVNDVVNLDEFISGQFDEKSVENAIKAVKVRFARVMASPPTSASATGAPVLAQQQAPWQPQQPQQQAPWQPQQPQQQAPWQPQQPQEQASQQQVSVAPQTQQSNQTNEPSAEEILADLASITNAQ